MKWLAVVGGDGTIGECLGGMDLPRQRFAILPAGHGNCLGRDPGLCRPRDAIEALRRLQCRPLDLMGVTVGRRRLPDVMLQRCGWPRQQRHNGSLLAGSRAFGSLGMRQLPRAGFQLDSPRTLMADGELLPGVMRVSVECRRAAVTCVATVQ